MLSPLVFSQVGLPGSHAFAKTETRSTMHQAIAKSALLLTSLYLSVSQAGRVYLCDLCSSHEDHGGIEASRDLIDLFTVPGDNAETPQLISALWWIPAGVARHSLNPERDSPGKSPTLTGTLLNADANKQHLELVVINQLPS